MGTRASALPEPIWLGYRLRQPHLITQYQDFGIDTGHIVEICAFGHPIWGTGTNAAACFRRENAVPEWIMSKEEQALAEAYVYRAFPLVFDTSGVPRLITSADLLGKGIRKPRLPHLQRYTRLGYDITECSLDRAWQVDTWSGCSPLSFGCNGIASAMGTVVNDHCLVDDVGAAYDLATLFGIQRPEPGPYLIVEVWRRTLSVK